MGLAANYFFSAASFRVISSMIFGRIYEPENFRLL